MTAPDTQHKRRAESARVGSNRCRTRDRSPSSTRPAAPPLAQASSRTGREAGPRGRRDSGLAAAEAARGTTAAAASQPPRRFSARPRRRRPARARNGGARGAVTAGSRYGREPLRPGFRRGRRFAASWASLRPRPAGRPSWPGGAPGRLERRRRAKCSGRGGDGGAGGCGTR